MIKLQPKRNIIGKMRDENSQQSDFNGIIKTSVIVDGFQIVNTLCVFNY